MKRRWKIAALALVGGLALLVGIWCYFGQDDDPFTAKYRLIQEGAPYDDVERLLGSWDAQLHLGGYHTYYWESPDSQTLVVTWDMQGNLRGKALVGTDGAVILSQEFERRRPRPWWERFLSRVGLR
jgi:hypothetical protein